MLTVCVIFGGMSSEHEVSLRSATSVLENLDREKYKIRMVGITREGRWLYFNGPASMIQKGDWERSSFVCPVRVSVDPTAHGLVLDRSKDGTSASQKLRNRLLTEPDLVDEEERVLAVDVVFPVLHGKNGEDGTIQGLLDLAGIPYVGCGVLASAACMDKEVTHLILEKAGVPKTKLVVVRPTDMEDWEAKADQLEKELQYPIFVKPANAGSSVGITKVEQREKLPEALWLAFAHDGKAVVEQAVSGQEVESAVMGNDEPVVSGVLGEIAPKNEFYDYAGKYLDDSTDLYIPARLGRDVAASVRETAARAYRAMGCRGLARVDFFVRESGEVILNEINTMPGFTSISMYPKLFEADGFTYSELLDKLIEYALED